MIALCACAGCHANLGGNGSNDGVDASGGDDDSGPPPGIDAAITPPIDAAPACASGRVLYLNFDGQALTDAPSDATLNRASWIIDGTPNPAAPPSNRGAANRLAIVTGVTAQLAAYPISVVTTRPMQSPYMMVLFGGGAGNVGSRFGGAVQELDCGDLRKNDVAWVADAINPPQVAINYTIGAIGFGLGLTATQGAGNCMCGWDNGCIPTNTAPCTLSPMISRDNTANQTCLGLTTQDEVAAFQTGFCQ